MREKLSITMDPDVVEAVKKAAAREKKIRIEDGGGDPQRAYQESGRTEEKIVSWQLPHDSEQNILPNTPVCGILISERYRTIY